MVMECRLKIIIWVRELPEAWLSAICWTTLLWQSLHSHASAFFIDLHLLQKILTNLFEMKIFEEKKKPFELEDTGNKKNLTWKFFKGESSFCMWDPGVFFSGCGDM